jgi:hypothetical protein
VAASLSSSSSSSSSDSFKEIECLDANILAGHGSASKPQRFAHKSSKSGDRRKRERNLESACLAMEEYHSQSEDDEPCIDELIHEINQQSDMVGSFCSLPENNSSNQTLDFRFRSNNSPLVGNSPRIPRTAKCLCKIKCKCKCHRLKVGGFVQTSGTNSRTSSHCSSQIVFENLSLDWEDLNLELVEGTDGKVR